MMNDLTKGNQCRKRIADNRQAHRAEPLTWQYSELKGQRPNLAPRLRRLFRIFQTAHMSPGSGLKMCGRCHNEP